MNKIHTLFSDSYKEFKDIRSLAMAGLLAAFYAVSYSPFAGNFIIVRGMIEIRFGFIVIAVAAMLFGPAVAPAVAVIGDIIGTIVFYGGSFFWGYTLSWFIQGIVFGLFFYHMKNSIPRVCLSMLFNTCIINLIFTTKWEEMMGFGTFTGLFFKRLPLNIVMMPVNGILLFFVLRAVTLMRRRAAVR